MDIQALIGSVPGLVDKVHGIDKKLDQIIALAAPQQAAIPPEKAQELLADDHRLLLAHCEEYAKANPEKAKGFSDFIDGFRAYLVDKLSVGPTNEAPEPESSPEPPSETQKPAEQKSHAGNHRHHKR